jgi:hypothetical protein
MLPTYQRLNASNSGKIRSFRASEKILVFLVFVSFLVIVLFGFFLLPDFAGTNGSSMREVYNKFRRAGPEIFIPAPPIAEKSRDPVDNDRQRLAEKIRSELDINLLEKPILQEPDKVPIVPIPVPDHRKTNKHHHEKDKTTYNSLPVESYDVDGSDEDPVTRTRRDKVKEVC